MCKDSLNALGNLAWPLTTSKDQAFHLHSGSLLTAVCRIQSTGILRHWGELNPFGFISKQTLILALRTTSRLFRRPYWLTHCDPKHYTLYAFLDRGNKKEKWSKAPRTVPWRCLCPAAFTEEQSNKNPISALSNDFSSELLVHKYWFFYEVAPNLQHELAKLVCLLILSFQNTGLLTGKFWTYFSVCHCATCLH